LEGVALANESQRSNAYKDVFAGNLKMDEKAGYLLGAVVAVLARSNVTFEEGVSVDEPLP
jgi:hypothetical protein